MPLAEISGIDLRPRDIALLRDLFESRIMSSAHVCALHFDGNAETAKKRVQKLKKAGLIRERPRRVIEQSALFLTLKAFRFLHSKGHISDYPGIDASSFEKRNRVSDLTIRHELDVMDVKAAFIAAIKRTTQFDVAEFSTWPVLYNFKACRPSGERAIVKPDGFVRIHEKESDRGLSEHLFFLEVDRSTESLEILAQRAHCYMDFYRTGGLAVRFGATANEYKEFPFRVLVICKSGERQRNLALRLLQNIPPITTQVWTSQFTSIIGNALGQIWTRPLDYSTQNRSYQSEVGQRSEAKKPPSTTHHCLFSASQFA